MEIALALKILDIIGALVASGFSFDQAASKVSGMIKQRQSEGAAEITDADLQSVFDGTDAKIAAARAQFEKTLADPNTPQRT